MHSKRPRDIMSHYFLEIFRGVAQLASALALGARGRGFESPRPDFYVGSPAPP